MPVDFETYVLSSSPPGFDLNYVVNDHFTRHDESRGRRKRSKLGVQATWHEISASLAEETESHDDVEAARLNRSDITSEKTLQRISSWDLHYRCDPETQKCDCPMSQNAGMGKRKISFADELGRRLEAIRIMEECSDIPPTLHNSGSNSSLGSDEFVSTPKLAVNFQQPASDYMTFRNTVDSKFVSLENVVVKNYSLMGTVRVKNVSFEKSVSIRYTLNNWQTFAEVQAAYVPSGISEDRFNTFSFALECPPDLQTGSKLLFAVRYVGCGGQEFWDSNNGDNYEVIYVASCNDVPKSSGRLDGFNGHSDGLWTEFSGWQIGSDSPYY